jgi:type I restriction enzyme S subunit
VGAVIIPLPPFKKQVEIVDYLNTAIAPIDDAIKNCQNQISLLQERKQIIINEVVTGKVKVSN